MLFVKTDSKCRIIGTPEHIGLRNLAKRKDDGVFMVVWIDLNTSASLSDVVAHNEHGQQIMWYRP